MKVRLGLTLLRYRPPFFSYVNDVVVMLINKNFHKKGSDSNLNKFLSDLDLVLVKITKENKLVFSMSDWNLNLINHHCHI